MARRILRRPELLAQTGLSRTRQYALEKQGLFPVRVTLGPRAVGWYSDEVESWLAQRPRSDAK